MNFVNRDNQGKAVKLLRDAKRHWRIGYEKLGALLKPPFTLYINDHSTGCQCDISMTGNNLPIITAWQGSVWYSACYEFNDRDKALGINPECLFAQPALEKFFLEAQELFAQAIANDDIEKTQKKANLSYEKILALNEYASMITKANTP